MFYADLHIHSHFSRATSRDCGLEQLYLWGRKKGLSVLATGDITHPGWRAEIQDKLVPAEPGLFRLRPALERALRAELHPTCHGELRFLLSVEIATIYKCAGKTRKVHHVVYVPSVESAERLCARLAPVANLEADGRPILGLDSRDLLEMVLESGPGAYLVPAHIWTPWFSVLGSKSGFDAIEDCYRDLAPHVFAIETGLSSDPPMNERLSRLDRYCLLSNSDAHSPPNLGRNACVFETERGYFAMRHALETGTGYAGTVELFPEKGKYHYDGHRKCGVCLTPPESQTRRGLCPVCGTPLTLGVLHRIDALADRPTGGRRSTPASFRSLIPLPELLAEIEGVGAKSLRVGRAYEALLARFGPELPFLESLPLAEMEGSVPPVLVEAIRRMRAGEVLREPGYDGEYGRIHVFAEGECARFSSPAPENP